MKASLPRLNSFTAFKENAYGKPVGADPPWPLLHRLLSARQPPAAPMPPAVPWPHRLGHGGIRGSFGGGRGGA